MWTTIMSRVSTIVSVVIVPPRSADAPMVGAGAPAGYPRRLGFRSGRVGVTLVSWLLHPTSCVAGSSGSPPTRQTSGSTARRSVPGSPPRYAADFACLVAIDPAAELITGAVKSHTGDTKDAR